MDYKSGSREFSLAALYYGLQLQLVVYMNAAMEIAGKKHPEKEIVPAAMLYYRVQDPMIEMPEGEPSAEEVNAQVLRALRTTGIVNAREDVVEVHGVKLHPDIQGFRLDDPRCFALAEQCEGVLPLLLHTGDSRYDFSNPNRLIPLLRRFPRLTVIGAHFGGYTIWQEAARQLAGRFENLWVDCSSSFFAMDVAAGRALIDAYGADRVLFGTDYPMWDPQHELARLRGMRLAPETERKILYDNAAALFGLEGEN